MAKAMRMRSNGAKAGTRLLGLLLLALFVSGSGQAAQLQYFHRPFGDSLSRYHSERRRTYDLQHVLLRLRLDERHKSVSGTSTLTLRPLHAGLKTVEVDSAELQIHSVTAPDGKRLWFSQSRGKLHIRLPAAAGPHDLITISIAFSGTPRKGLYFVEPDASYPRNPVQIWSQGEAEDSHYWFPVYDYPNDKATTEGYFTVNSDFTVISNGRLVGVRENPADHTKTYHWKEDIPHSTYLTSVVAGRFEHYRETADGIPLDYYVPPGTGRKKALRTFRETPAAIQFFANRIGIPYPYSKYSQVAVHDFVFGGMENITATTLTDRALHAQASEPQEDSVDLVTHELAHQWFGDLLTCADWSQIWLNEGFATFWADVYREHRFGEQDYRYTLYQQEAKYLQEDRSRYRRPMVTAYYTDPLDLFDHSTYEKGALVLDMLRFVLGDKLFFAAITHYAKEHEGGTVVTDDLRKAVEESSGQDLGWFFDEWTAKAGYPELRVTEQWNESTRTVHLVIEQQQLVDGQTPLFRMPVDVEFTTRFGRTRKRIVFSHVRDEFNFTLDGKPLMTRFDPEHRILAIVRFSKPLAELLYQLKQDPAAVGRILTMKQLVQYANSPADSRKVFDALRQVLLRDCFWGVRRAAAADLGRIDTEASRKALGEALHDKDARVRQASVRALGKFVGDTKAAKLAKAAYKHDRNDFVQAEAVLSIARIHPEGTRNFLEHAVNRNSDHDVIRRYALRGLGELGNPDDWNIVAQWLTHSPFPGTRIAAIDALLKLGDAEDGKTGRTLIALLKDPNIFVREHAISALGVGNFQQARQALINSAQHEPDSRVRRSARTALSRLGAGLDPKPALPVGKTRFGVPNRRFHPTPHQLRASATAAEQAAGL